MAQPVWILSVDLQTKTATFQSGLADAAKTARGAFTDIKTGATEMGGHVSTNMFASRHAIMAVSEALGDTMPRAITALLVHIGPLGAALEAAFPFAAIALGAVLLVEHFEKLKEAGQQLTLDQEKFGTAVQNAFNALDQKLLQAQIRSDELHNNHLAALHHQLVLIDRQSMDELVHSFAEVAKASDVAFAELKSHWYTFGIGSSGAKHALDEFQAKYESLLAQSKSGEASDLLKGTRESAERVLALQQQAKAGSYAGAAAGQPLGHDDMLKHEAAINGLKAAGVGYSEKEIAAQQALLGALNAQVDIEQKVAELKKTTGSNATTSYGNEEFAKRAAAAKAAAEHTSKMGEISLAAEREQAAVSATLHNATIAERLASDSALANKEYAIQLQGNQQLIAALDRAGKDYNNQLKGLQDKALEITAQHQTTLAVLQGKATMEQYRKDLADMEESEREKINATEQGSAARLAAIDAAIKEEQDKNLQGTAHYRELLTQRVEVARQAALEESKQSAEAARIGADDALKMGLLSLAAHRQHEALVDSGRRVSIQMRQQEELAATTAEYALKLTAMAQEIAALDKHGKDYQNKLRELQNKEKQLVQQHENEVTAIKDKAEMERNQRILSAEQRAASQIATGLTQSIMGHQTWAHMLTSFAEQAATGLIQNSLMVMMQHDKERLSDARKTATTAYSIGEKMGGPAGLILGPIFAASAFAGVMAFQDGGIVPGIGRGDKIPAMLEPGEGVVPGGIMDGLRTMARNGQMGGGTTVHARAHFAPIIHAVDAAGVDRMLAKHADKFKAHFENAIRKMNK